MEPLRAEWRELLRMVGRAPRHPCEGREGRQERVAVTRAESVLPRVSLLDRSNLPGPRIWPNLTIGDYTLLWIGSHVLVVPCKGHCYWLRHLPGVIARLSVSLCLWPNRHRNAVAGSAEIG